jgi:uncharacterized membrane protein
MNQQSNTSKGSDRQLQLLLGNALRTGVLAAAVVVCVGGALYLARHGSASPDYQMFKGEPSDLCSVVGIARAALSGSGRGIIQLGFLLLIATPVMRVALALAGFAGQRDAIYLAVSLTVLLLLLYSLSGGYWAVW